MAANGFQNYKEQSILTMTSGELLVTLYDELAKRIKRAEIALDMPNYELFDASIQRSTEIIAYLIDTLDFEYPISRDLLNMYDFFIYELSRAKASRKPEVLREILPLVIDLKVTFKQASNNV